MENTNADFSAFDLMRLWGKARPATTASCDWHPLVCHCLDVAAVGEKLLDLHAAKVERLAKQLEWSTEAFRGAVLLLLAVHDLGKVSQPFQAKVPAHWPEPIFGAMRAPMPADPGHGSVGIWLALEIETRAFEPVFDGWGYEERRALLAPFFGHHGRPVAAPGNAQPRLVLGTAGRAAAGRLVALMREHFAVSMLPEPQLAALFRVSWWLAGIAVLADWLGSWQDVFAYEQPTQSLGDYWPLAQERAREAITRAGIAPVAPTTTTGLGPLTGQAWAPNAVQTWAEVVVLPAGPICAFIEDMTGSGKTEAALVLAHRLLAEKRAIGVYVALPTMATANAMYDRLADVYRRMFDAASTPSIALAYARAVLHEGFREAIQGLGNKALQAADPDDDERGDASNAACSAWLASESRKAFLADIGVGTIDQALLGVLPAKFQSLRLLGLADRVLIVDEAHAYDAYMSEELARLLEFQAALGGNAIVLSATLSETARCKLADAFQRGLGAAVPAFGVRDYPRVTLLSATGMVEAGKPSRADLRRILTVERLGDQAAALEVITAAAARGAAVAWVRNTVDDAIEAAEALRSAGHEVALFHARMAMGDRLKVEQSIVRRFGKHREPAKRTGIVVATQVIEQSLDLDFDLMVSDLAPVDLLLQRAGRVWRHMTERPLGVRPVPGPHLFVVSPDPAGPVPHGWFTDLFPRAGAVYPDHALLWKTAIVLFEAQAGKVRVPEDVRAVIEAVYGERAVDDVPIELERAAVDAQGNRQAERSHAWANLLKVGDGYGGEHDGWQHDVKTPTRLGEETITLRLARFEAGVIVPWIADADPRLAWAFSEISVRRTKVATVPDSEDSRRRAAIERAKAAWPKWERDSIPILVVGPAGDDRWQAMVEGRRGPIGVTYSAGEGLRYDG